MLLARSGPARHGHGRSNYVRIGIKSANSIVRNTFL